MKYSVFSAALCSILVLPSLITQVAALDTERDLIGWSERQRNSHTLDTNLNGGTDNTLQQQQQQQGNAPGKNSNSNSTAMTKKRGMEVLSWEPRIILYRGFLSEEECDYLVKKATPRLARSGVVEEGGGDGISDVRTSNGMFFERAEDKTIEEIELRLSEWALIPPGNGEGFQVLRYEKDQEYKGHFDYFFDTVSVSNGGNRLATVLMYLASPESGGETVFGNVPTPATQTREAGFSECAMDGLAVKAEKGDAVLFWSLTTAGTLDKGSLHGSCPVISGIKYAATKWYHVGHYATGREKPKKVEHVKFVPPTPPAPPGCRDNKFECKGWSEGGECESNSGYMVGTKANPGECLLSCHRCDLMPEADKRAALASLGRKDLI
jgi:prolyl 4-hydroxylase